MPAEKIAVAGDIDKLLINQAQRRDTIRNVLPFFGLFFTILLLTIATRGLLLSGQNLVNIINQCFTTALVAVGAAFVYAYGGMDFSLGPACGLAQIVFIGSFMRFDIPVWVGVILAISTCVIATMIVGAGSYLLHLQPFIVSLCVRSICTGLLEAGNNSMGGKIVVPMDTFGFFNDDLLKAIVLAVALIIGWFLFEKTKLGKEAKLIGGNRVTAWQSGIRPLHVIVLSHLFLGVMVGVAGCFMMARNGMITAGTGGGLEFNIMIAMALGGFPMEGGAAAKIRSVIIGVLTITFLTNGLTIAGVDNSYINITKGILFVVIVALSYDRTNVKQVVFM